MRTGIGIASAALAQESWPLIGGTTACLNFVTWMADKAGTGYTNANDAWADQRNSHHPASETPPIGAIGFFGGGPNGDAAIRVPGSLWRSVNANPKDLRCVSQTTAQREASTGNRYYGWLGGLGGEAIDFTSTSGGGTIPIEEEDMQADERQALFQIKQFLTETTQWDGLLKVAGRTDKTAAQILALVSKDSDFDEAEFAKQLAPLVIPQLVASLGDELLTDEDIVALRTDLLSAIAQVDESTLATFGLKRA